MRAIEYQVPGVAGGGKLRMGMITVRYGSWPGHTMPKTNATVDTTSKSTHIAPAISYRLSEKAFLDLGWTAQPLIFKNEKRLVTMKAKFTHSLISPWFLSTKHVSTTYPNGSVLYEGHGDGSGSIYYPNGKVAIKIEKRGVNKLLTRIWVYGTGEADEDGLRQSHHFCALFDSLGHGVVYDECMNVKLVYNQLEGIIYGHSPVRWKWHDFPLPEAPANMHLEDFEGPVIIEEPPRPVIFASAPSGYISSDKMSNLQSVSAVSGFSYNPAVELSKTELNFRIQMEHARYVNTSQIRPRETAPLKPIALRISKYVSLRIFSQSDVSLYFRAGRKHTKLKIGVLFNPIDKLKVTPLEVNVADGEVLCPYEHFPPRTLSLVKIRNTLKRLRKKSCISKS